MRSALPTSLPGCCSGRTHASLAPGARTALPRVATRLTTTRAAPGGGGGRRSPLTASYPSGLDPALELAVPVDQRPVNELAALREAPLYSWASFG